MKFQNGFTLIELMIVVVIVAILASVGYPSYVQYVTRANRANAESYLMSVANLEEQYMLNARQYAGVAASPGDATGLATLGTTVPTDVSKNYDITIGSVALTPPAYVVTATPVPGGSQATNDTYCGAVFVDQTGAKRASTGATDCWRH